MDAVTVLGIPVACDDIERWLGFYAPGRQSFRTRGLPASVVDSLPDTSSESVTDELRDTFFMYGAGPWAWLSEDEFAELEPDARAALVTERRDRVRPKPAPAWPTDPMIVPKLVRWVEAGTRPSLHELAREQLGRASRGSLPRAGELAGRFPSGSGPNCFGTVMAAAGEPVEKDWVQLDQFQLWLDAHTTPAASRDDPRDAGQVLVWRHDGELAHAAVTIGEGWVLQKASQSWSSPVGVWLTEEVINQWRTPGVRLSRHRLA
ncbi:hypothetical protein MWU75_03915 [Ornithinimicrobium sp. F0845]|uniref:hypothetical protein n=1 Tax=Ornithinimicrobium sp. F0845 TaxID=2926412 RepID=UPI001FF47E06|nr:hypothetical protein [Ornithinimicrobium sp. F0845]MCK0111285.1 hypothetical protein [Ornithinimicrobium sp. F0845]